MPDLEWFRSFQFPKISSTLGPVKMTVSMIRAGLQHNIVPDSCAFTVDVRTTDQYTNAEVLDIINTNTSSDILPRSLRLNPSAIDPEHPLVRAGVQLGRSLYGSPTTSDQALMSFPTIKMGPGDSARSHTADEFIFIREIEEGIDLYVDLLNTLNKLL
jgi:acetylornithine deacetylase